VLPSTKRSIAQLGPFLKRSASIDYLWSIAAISKVILLDCTAACSSRDQPADRVWSTRQRLRHPKLVAPKGQAGSAESPVWGSEAGETRGWTAPGAIEAKRAP
jgi:hypothetical protein